MPRNDPDRRGVLRRVMLVLAVVLTVLMPQATATVTASAADNPYQRGPAPTQASITASRGTFATAEPSVGGGNGVGAAKIYYPTDTDPVFSLKGAASAKCADVSGFSQTNGSPVIIWPCSGQGNQIWTQTAAGELRIYNNTKCLDAGSAQTGGRVVINPCSGSSGQKWSFNTSGTVTNPSSGRCLDTAGGATADTTAVVVANCTGGSGQTWAKSSLAVTGDGSPSDSNIRYVGRWDTRLSTGYVPGWAGAYAVVGFTGTSVKLRQRNSVDLYASIDGGSWVTYRGVYGLVNLTPTRLASGTHTLRVSYRQATGSYHGDLVFQGVTLDAGARTVAPSVPSRVVEFVGDSITAGEKASKMAITSYGWVTGEKLGAAHVQVARASVCLYPISGCFGLRDLYLKTTFDASSPDWDFSRYQAGDVLINLGTNDRGHNVSSSQFQTAYVTLMQRIRAKYPNANIYAMETFLKLYVNETKAAVAARNAAGDSKVRFINTEGWINPSTDTVDGTHPNDAGHLKIANHLVTILG